jgi:spore coat-associated protein N
MTGRFGRVRRVTAAPVLATIGVLGVTAAVVGGLAFATFTSTTSVTQNVGSGNVAFASLTPSGAGQRLSVAATDIAPGDTIQRAVTLTNTGSVNMDSSAVRLTTSATTSSLLDTGSNGLLMAIDKCSVAWTESAAPYTYTCGGTTTTVLASSPVIVANQALANINTAPSIANNLRVTLTLPTAADNTYQNQSSVISYAFAGTQRAGTNR